jgi:hypothetical protein
LERGRRKEKLGRQGEGGRNRGGREQGEKRRRRTKNMRVHIFTFFKVIKLNWTMPNFFLVRLSSKKHCHID